ncbi:MAG: tetratricopeptide repeat protein [Gemmatimonadota bacterium]|nr:MAG: tetratricopeptide repeat protein [Gemmatimonadota bacterium]
MKRKHVSIIACLVIGSLCGCSKDQEVHIIAPPSVDSKVQAGWTDFTTGKYASAVRQFESAISQDASCYDAYNGMGWSLFKQGEFSAAIDYFQFLLPLREVEPDLAADAYAGLAAIYMTQNEDVLAIFSGWEALNIAEENGKEYTFTHDPTITAEDIHVINARCLYNIGEFFLSHVEVKAVDPTFPPPAIIPYTTVVETVATIDSTRIEFSSWLSWGTLIFSTRVGNVISILSVSDTLGSADYEVIYAWGEGGDVFITAEDLPPLGTPFIIEYAYVDDYFEYLILLAEKVQSLAAL